MPLVLVNLCGQIIEQFRMRRAAAHVTEIARRIDQPGAEVVMPQTIRQHAGRKWIRRIDNPIRQRQATLRLRFTARQLVTRRDSFEHRKTGRNNLFSTALRISTQENIKRTRSGREVSHPPVRQRGNGSELLLSSSKLLVEPGYYFTHGRIGIVCSQDGHLLHFFSIQFGDLLFERFRFFAMSGAIFRRSHLATAMPDARECRLQRMIVGLQDRIELMIVAAGTTDGEPEKRLAGGADHFVDGVCADLAAWTAS